MHAQTKARLIAAIALPLLALDISRAHAAPPAAISPAVAQRLPHITIAASGPRSAPAVVLIPGLSSPGAVWSRIVPTLAKDHHVLVVQVNGFGGDAPGDNLKPGLLDGIVADLHGYLAARKLRQVDVIGHSMGGLAALMWAKAHPADLHRLMVVDSLPYIGEIFVPGATVAQMEPQARAMRDAMAASYGTPANRGAAAATAERLALKPESRAMVTEWMGHADARVTAQAFYEDMTTDLRPDMATIATPITLVYPWSAAVPEAEAAGFYRKAYATAPHVTFVPVGDSAHFVMLDQPAAFAAAVTAFLR